MKHTVEAVLCLCLRSCLAVLLTLTACSLQRPRQEATSSSGWRTLFDGKSLGSWAVTNFGGQGQVMVEDARLVLEPGSPLTGIQWTGDFPSQDYELQIEAARIDGSDFFCALNFPVGPDFLTLVVGGWGGSLVGLSCLDGKDASSNSTMQIMRFDNQRIYVIELLVKRNKIRARIDHKTVLEIDPRQYELSLRPELRPMKPLGIASFASTAAINKLAWRPLTRSP